MDKELLSVIIPTFNGGSKVLRALESLRHQTDQGFEVIIVNDGSTDNTKDIIEQQLNNYPFQIRLFNQENKGRAVVRNRGAKEAGGNILVFMDDDMRHRPNVISLHRTHHLKFPDSIVVGDALEDYEAVQNDIQRYKAGLSRQWSAPLQEINAALTRDNLFLTAANFSIPKTLFFKLKGFDERLTDAEDFDLGLRAIKEGVPIYFNGEIIGWHDDFITVRSYIKRLRQYQKAQVKIRALKPGLYKDYDRHNNQPDGYFRKLVYGFFAQKYWVDVIEKETWLTSLPEMIRFKIYSLVIDSLSYQYPEKEI